MISRRYSKMGGAISGQLVAIFGLLFLVVALSGLSAWMYIQYDEQKTNVDGKIALAEAEARRQQAEEDEVKIRAIEEEPNREFAGPEDYGSLSFEYPKNWSVYVANDTTSSGNRFVAYLHPVVVPPVNSREARFALRVNIDSTSYDRALDSYRRLVERGDLTSRPITVNDHNGTRFDGNFNNNIRGSTVVFRVRDKTITISTDAETFKSYFDTIVQTIDFND